MIVVRDTIDIPVDPIDAKLLLARCALITVIRVAYVDVQIKLASALRACDAALAGDTTFLWKNEFLDEEIDERIDH